jgi:hypothetical protein
MKKYLIPKLIGLSVLAMITLVIISFLEVAVYSYLIHPGQDEGAYEAHAESTAPVISCIFGFILFYLVSRYWTRKGYPNASKLAILYPLVYVLIDALIITLVAAERWASFVLIFALANLAKFLGSYLGHRMNRVEVSAPAQQPDTTL